MKIKKEGNTGGKEEPPKRRRKKKNWTAGNYMQLSMGSCLAEGIEM